MNHLNLRSRLTAALALVLSLVTGGLSGAQKPINLKLGTLAPSGSTYHKSLQAMGEKWRNATGGAVRLTIYAGGTQGSESDMVGLMQTGSLDAGLLTAVGLSEIEPGVSGLQNMPMSFRTLEEVDYVGEKLRPLLEKRLAAKGYAVLFWCDSGWVRFFTTAPVLHPADLKKLKIFSWAGDTHQYDIWKAAGFNPVSLETAGVLQGFLSGTISAIDTPPLFALASQIDGQARHMLRTQLGASGRRHGRPRQILGPRPGREPANPARGRHGSRPARQGRGPRGERQGRAGHGQTRLARAEGQPGGRAKNGAPRRTKSRPCSAEKSSPWMCTTRCSGCSENSGPRAAESPNERRPPLDPAAAKSRFGWVRQAENILLIVPLSAMMLLPVVEILLRSLFKTGISGSSTIVQHLTLIVGMLGGAVAARDERLLALSPAQTLLKGRAKTAARIFSSGFAAAISAFLCVASLQYVLDVRPLGKLLVYGLPVWVVQMILPAGFGVVACRLVWHASARWGGRSLALALGLALRRTRPLVARLPRTLAHPRPGGRWPWRPSSGRPCSPPWAGPR